MSNYLVTGAAGFIGSAVAQQLSRQGHRVVTIDNLSTGFKEAIPDGVVFHEGNCQDTDILAQLEEQPFDAILHIAGQSSGEISFDDPVYDLQTNTQSTLQLLQYAVKTGCPRFVYASTMSVYGQQPDEHVNEQAIVKPKSFYAIGKLASEHYMRIYQKQHGIQTVALRLFNVYGPGQNMLNLRQGMVSIFLAQALQNRHIHVKGSPDRYRDLIYIDDVVDAFLKALSYQAEEPSVFNIARGIRTTVRALIGEIVAQLPFEITIEYQGTTPGDMFGIYGNATAAAENMAWSANIDLQTGLRRMVKWAQKEMLIF